MLKIYPIFHSNLSQILKTMCTFTKFQWKIFWIHCIFIFAEIILSFPSSVSVSKTLKDSLISLLAFVAIFIFWTYDTICFELFTSVLNQTVCWTWHRLLAPAIFRSIILDFDFAFYFRQNVTKHFYRMTWCQEIFSRLKSKCSKLLL